MEVRKIPRDPSKSGINKVADISIVDDYDPHSPPAPSPEFERFMKTAMESSESFRSWIQGLRLR